MPGRRLLISLHDVAPQHFARLERIHALLDELGIGPAYAMLVVPNYHRRGPLDQHPEFVRWLRTRADQGVEMILHGLYHVDETEHRSFLDRARASGMTNREGEFLGLGYDEARERLDAGRLLLESVLERPVEGFVAPAWLYSKGTHRALHAAGFRFAEDHWKVWTPGASAPLVQSPVVTYSTTNRWRYFSALVWSRVSTLLLRPLPVIRFGIHPPDLEDPRVARELRRALRSFLCSHRPARYADLVLA